MLYWVYDTTSLEFLYGAANALPYDPATQGMETYPVHPDPATERWDGTAPGKKRLATEQELTTSASTHQASNALSAFNQEKLVASVVIWTAGKLSIPLATARQEILAIYKGL